MLDNGISNDEVLRLLHISDFKKRYLESIAAVRAKVNPRLMKVIRNIEDGLSSIGELDLSNSNFNDEQLIPILNILKGDTVVHTLNLSNNNIKSLSSFITLMRDNHALVKLDLSNNPIDISLLPDLLQAANVNKTIMNINMCNNAYPDNKLLVNYVLNDKKMKIRTKQLYTEPSQPLGYSVVFGSLHSSINSTRHTTNINTPDNESVASYRAEQSSKPYFDLSRYKMSRMDWIMSLKRVYEDVRTRNSGRSITVSSLIEEINANISKFPLLSDVVYDQTNVEVGYSVDEIIQKIKERSNDRITYDDIFDSISQISQRGNKSNGLNRLNMKSYDYTNANLPSSTKIFQVKANDQLLQKEKQPVIKTTSSPFRARSIVPQLNIPINNDLRDIKIQNCFLPVSDRNNKSLQINYKINEEASSRAQKLKGDDLTDEIYGRIKSSQSNIRTHLKEFESNSARIQRSVEDVTNIDDFSTIEQKSDFESDWLMQSEPNSDTTRIAQLGSIHSPLLSETSFCKHEIRPKFQEPPAAYNFSIELLQENERADETNGMIAQVPPESSISGPSRKKSIKTIQQFLSSKVKNNSPVSIHHSKNLREDTSSQNIGGRPERLNRDAQVSMSQSRLFGQKPPLITTLHATPMHTSVSEKIGYTPRSLGVCPKVPVTNSALGKSNEIIKNTPSRLNSQVIQSMDVVSTSISKEPKTRSDSSQTRPEKSVVPNNKLYSRFFELLTSFNTFYNENSSLLSAMDVEIINMINGFSIKKYKDNESKIAICFSHIRNIEVRELLIYPLLKTILSSVEVLKIENCLLSQESFADLIPENLISLNLSSNNINDLRCLKTCRNLEFINLSRNQIEEIKGFIMCPKLKEIILSSNKIKVVKNLSKLVELRLLDLSDNLIQCTSSIQTLQQNQQLLNINLRENPVSLKSGYRRDVFDTLPQLKYLDAELDNVSDYADFSDFAFELRIEEKILSKKLSTSKSSSLLTSSNTARRGVLKKSAVNPSPISGGLSSSRSQTQLRSIAPSARIKAPFYDIESQSLGSINHTMQIPNKYQSSRIGSMSDGVFTIDLDINTLNM